MSHELTIREDGFVEMAFLEGVQRWHGLGNELKPGATIEEWKKAAGMDHTLLKAFVRYPTSRANVNDPESWKASDSNVVIFRGDNFAEMGVVSKKFQLVQPGAVFDFFVDLVAAANEESSEDSRVSLSTAGTIFEGREYWVMATIGKDAFVADKRDRVKANLLLSTACDGTRATEARNCMETVVCRNTLRAAQSEGKTGVVRVTHRSKFEPQKVKAELGIASAISTFDSMVKRMREMASTPMSQDLMLLATCGLLNPGYAELDQKEQEKIVRSKPVDTIARLVIDNQQIAADYEGRHGTPYAWLNAVTEYVDHHARAKSDSHRMAAAFFGKGSDLKERAYEMAGTVTDNVRASGSNAALASVNTWLQANGGIADLSGEPIDDGSPM